MFITIGQSTAFLQYLSLAEEDLSMVGKNILVLGVVQLGEVDLSDTKLSKEQLDTLLETIASTTDLSLISLRMSSLSSWPVCHLPFSADQCLA